MELTILIKLRAKFATMGDFNVMQYINYYSKLSTGNIKLKTFALKMKILVFIVLSTLIIINLLHCSKNSMEISPEKTNKFGGIQGQVIDSLTLIGIPEAEIITQPPTKNYYTDTLGNYIISEVITGEYIVKVSKDVYEKDSLLITVKSKDTSIANFYLNKIDTTGSKQFKIVFDSVRDTMSREIYLMNKDGSDLINLTNNPASDYYPIWSPDGNKIGFLSLWHGKTGIYVMNPDGSDRILLTDVGSSEAYPAWSPDGSKIAYNRFHEIYVIDPDGSNKLRLTNNSAHDEDHTWSPDGSKIAFSSDRDGNEEIYVMNSDGSNQINLTNNLASDVEPAWSPDGSKIAFISRREGNNSEIFIMDTDGCNPTRLTNNSYSKHRPSWSPDGEQIVYNLFFTADIEIYAMNADGSNPHNLSNSPELDWGAKYSPDGNFITFISWRDGNSEIYLMNTDGTNQINLTNNTEKDEFQNWSPVPIK